MATNDFPITARYQADAESILKRLSDVTAETDESRFLLIAAMYGELVTLQGRANLALEAEIAKFRS